MASGVPTPDSVEVEFRKHYLLTGNARAASRQVKIPESTGIDLAKRANEDPEFVRARSEMYARAMPDAERMLTYGLQIALDRLEQGAPTLGEMADTGAAKVTVQDPGPAYFRGIVDAYKALTANRKIDAEKSGGNIPRPVRIEIIAREDDDDGGNDPGVE